MFEVSEELEIELLQGKPEEQKKRRPKKIIIPRREPSVNIPEPRVLVMTAGIKPKDVKLNQCQVSPRTLYELSAEVVDKLAYPDPFEWNEEQVAKWMEEVVGFPQYKECITDNHINGRRLLRLEDPSVLPEINICDFIHVKKITSEVRKLFLTNYVLFARSIGLPIRKPFTLCTWFKSRTAPSWGTRQNRTRTDVLRWMKILMPKPVYMDHWDLVWYQKPDFPKVLLAKIPKAELSEDNTIPCYELPREDYCNEYTAPRRFHIQVNIQEEDQLIWMEHLPGSPSRKEPKTVEEKEKKAKKIKVKTSNVRPKKVSLTGLTGTDLVLARRKKAKTKFLA